VNRARGGENGPGEVLNYGRTSDTSLYQAMFAVPLYAGAGPGEKKRSYIVSWMSFGSRIWMVCYAIVVLGKPMWVEWWSERFGRSGTECGETSHQRSGACTCRRVATASMGCHLFVKINRSLRPPMSVRAPHFRRHSSSPVTILLEHDLSLAPSQPRVHCGAHAPATTNLVRLSGHVTRAQAAEDRGPLRRPWCLQHGNRR
jgi:hypothetical protein